MVIDPPPSPRIPPWDPPLGSPRIPGPWRWQSPRNSRRRKPNSSICSPNSWGNFWPFHHEWPTATFQNHKNQQTWFFGNPPKKIEMVQFFTIWMGSYKNFYLFGVYESGSHGKVSWTKLVGAPTTSEESKVRSRNCVLGAVTQLQSVDERYVLSKNQWNQDILEQKYIDMT